MLYMKMTTIKYKKLTITAIAHHSLLQDNNIKISKGRKKKSINVDANAYQRGIIDSKDIDINQQAIGHGTADS